MSQAPCARSCALRKWAQSWWRVYGSLWLATASIALTVGLAGEDVRGAVRVLLGLTLSAQVNPPPTAARPLALAAHNIPIAAWPLLLGALGIAGTARARRLADLLLACWLLANLAPVGAALGAYGAHLLPFIPQLPLEWAGLALGASAWRMERRSPISPRARAGAATLIAGLLLGAGALETYGVPHR